MEGPLIVSNRGVCLRRGKNGWEGGPPKLLLLGWVNQQALTLHSVRYLLPRVKFTMISVSTSTGWSFNL